MYNLGVPFIEPNSCWMWWQRHFTFKLQLDERQIASCLPGITSLVHLVEKSLKNFKKFLKKFSIFKSPLHLKLTSNQPLQYTIFPMNSVRHYLVYNKQPTDLAKPIKRTFSRKLSWTSEKWCINESRVPYLAFVQNNHQHHHPLFGIWSI